MPLPWGKIAIGLLIAIVSFGAALWALDLLWSGPKDRRPALVEIPPLPPATRKSVIVTPAAIALPAIHAALERAAPRNLAGKRDNPVPQLLSNAELDWTVARGPLAVTGRGDTLVVSTTLSGILRARGQVSGEAGNLAGAIGDLLGGRLGQGIQNLQGKTLDQRADIRGDVTQQVPFGAVTVKPSAPAAVPPHNRAPRAQAQQPAPKPSPRLTKPAARPPQASHGVRREQGLADDVVVRHFQKPPAAKPGAVQISKAGPK